MQKRLQKTLQGEQLTLFFDKNLETLKNVISCAEKSAKIRKAEERTKTNLLTKASSPLTATENYLTVKAESRRNVKYL